MRTILHQIVYSCYPVYLISMIIAIPVYILLFGIKILIIAWFFMVCDIKELKYSEYKRIRNDF